MLIGQNGAEKSGNYLLYRILKSFLISTDQWSSFSATSHCWESIFSFNDTSLSFPELESIDEFKIADDSTLYHYNSHFKASFAIWGIDDYDLKAALLWTHQAPKNSHHTVLSKERQWFYILRDGRAVVNSWMHYATSPRMLARHPQYTINSVEELYRQPGYFERIVRNWNNHVEAFIVHSNRYHLIRFEDLIHNKAQAIEMIASKLGIQDPKAINQAIAISGFNQSAKDAPEHVRKGEDTDWHKYFTDQHCAIFEKYAGETQRKFGYK